MTRNLFGDFLLRRLLTDFRGCDLSGRCRYPLRVENVPQISQIYTDFSWDVFFVTQISQMTQIFFSWDFFSSDFTEIIRRLTAAAITHGFSRMRPVRSLQIPPEVGKSPTDFTDIHRFFLGRFFVTQISQMTQIFFSHGIFFHRTTRNLFGEFLLRRLLTDFRGCDLSGRCRYPLRLTKRFTRDSIKNLCKSVKSVGQNPPTKKNLRHQRNLRDQNNRSIYRARVIGQRSKFREIP